MSSTDEYGKVILLEDAVINGTLDDVKTVYNTYKPFEITARALGLACRYRGLEFVRKLIELGATFVYFEKVCRPRRGCSHPEGSDGDRRLGI